MTTTRPAARHLGVAVLVLGLFATSCGGGSDPPATDTPTTNPPTTTAAPPTTTLLPSTSATTTGAPEPPSQSAVDAARDGVIAEIAALPIGLRVEIIDSVPTDEGVWAISRLAAAVDELADGCRLGSPDGKYPTDFICTREYGELLLLDPGRTSILRAYPLPGVPAEVITFSNDAVYCGRQGKIPMPDAMLCRVDRRTLDEKVMVFPQGLDSLIVQPCYYPPATWSVSEDSADITSLVADAGALYAQGSDGSWTLFDPAHLEILGHNVAPPPGYGS